MVTHPPSSFYIYKQKKLVTSQRNAHWNKDILNLKRVDTSTHRYSYNWEGAVRSISCYLLIMNSHLIVICIAMKSLKFNVHFPIDMSGPDNNGASAVSRYIFACMHARCWFKVISVIIYSLLYIMNSCSTSMHKSHKIQWPIWAGLHHKCTVYLMVLPKFRSNFRCELCFYWW